MADRASEILECIPRLRRFAYTLTGDVADADDLVQVCLERALAKVNRRYKDGDMQSWLFKIMQNAFIDDCRSKQRKPGFVHIDEDEVSGVKDLSPDPETQLAHKEVMASVKALPEDQRMIVGYILVDGRTYRETADLLGIPIGTVMSRLARARRSLAADLSFDMGGA
ncbi:MAG: sigma-70 family RNA polymerase sigma factor [Pseudomonadota bacterium]